MAIDPAHLPIFGDPRPSDPPLPVRAAFCLFLVQVLLSVIHLALTWARSDLDVSLYIVPLAVTVWFAVGMTAGRAWARVGVVWVSGLSVLLNVGLIATLADFALVAPMVLAVAGAALLMYRGDVGEYFQPTDDL